MTSLSCLMRKTQIGPACLRVVRPVKCCITKESFLRLNRTQFNPPGISGLVLPAKEGTVIKIMIAGLQRKLVKHQSWKQPYHVPQQVLLIPKQGFLPNQRKINGKIAFLAILPYPTSPQARRMRLKESVITSCALIYLISWKIIRNHGHPLDFGVPRHSTCLSIPITLQPTRELSQSGNMLRRCRLTRQHTISNPGLRIL